MSSDLLLSTNEVETQIGYSVPVLALTSAPDLFAKAISMDTTAILQDSGSPTANEFKKLTTMIIANEAKK